MCYKKKKIDNDNEMHDENGFGASGQSKVVGEQLKLLHPAICER